MIQKQINKVPEGHVRSQDDVAREDECASWMEIRRVGTKKHHCNPSFPLMSIVEYPIATSNTGSHCAVSDPAGSSACQKFLFLAEIDIHSRSYGPFGCQKRPALRKGEELVSSQAELVGDSGHRLCHLTGTRAFQSLALSSITRILSRRARLQKTHSIA